MKTNYTIQNNETAKMNKLSKQELYFGTISGEEWGQKMKGRGKEREGFAGGKGKYFLFENLILKCCFCLFLTFF